MICVHLDAMDTTENLPMVEISSGSIMRNKSLRTNHACTLCGLYGHYSHHCQELSEFQMDLANLWQHYLESEITLIEEIHPPPPSLDTISIYMMPSSTNPLVSTIVRISPHCRSRNGSLVPIGHKGRFLLLENRKDEMEMQVSRTVN